MKPSTARWWRSSARVRSPTARGRQSRGSRPPPRFRYPAEHRSGAAARVALLPEVPAGGIDPPGAVGAGPGRQPARRRRGSGPRAEGDGGGAGGHVGGEAHARVGLDQACGARARRRSSASVMRSLSAAKGVSGSTPSASQRHVGPPQPGLACGPSRCFRSSAPTRGWRSPLRGAHHVLGGALHHRKPLVARLGVGEDELT